MKTTIGLIACGLALVGPARGVVRAAPPERTAGRVLVLDNERTMEGDVRRLGDDYRVRRTVGEVWVPGDKVLRLCASWPEAYAFLRSRANLADPDERVRLARWCQLHGLRKEALAEADAAVALRPNRPELRRLQRLLRRAVAAAPKRPDARPRPEARKAPEAPPAVDLNTESLSRFTTQVQPILMNACASCHTGGRGGAFQLTRTYQGGVNLRATRFNLAAVLAQIDRRRPEVSPLLVKAVSAHGRPGQAPLKGRQTPAFRHLQEWIEQTLADNPHLLEAGTATAAAPEGEERPEPGRLPRLGPAGEVSSFHAAAPGNSGEVVQTAVVSMTGAGSAAGAAGRQPAGRSGPPPARTTPRAEPPPAGPADPFDPVLFNRQMHPDR